MNNGIVYFRVNNDVRKKLVESIKSITKDIPVCLRTINIVTFPSDRAYYEMICLEGKCGKFIGNKLEHVDSNICIGGDLHIESDKDTVLVFSNMHIVLVKEVHHVRGMKSWFKKQKVNVVLDGCVEIMD